MDEYKGNIKKAALLEFGRPVEGDVILANTLR